MDQVFLAGGDGDGDNVAGDFCGKSDGAGGALGGVLSHEEGAAADDALECAEEAASAAVLGGGVHFNGCGHPGEFAGDGDNAFIGIEVDFEDGHGGADDFVLHKGVLEAAGRVKAEGRKVMQGLDGRGGKKERWFWLTNWNYGR